MTTESDTHGADWLNHKTVSDDEWIAARRELLAKEKEYSRIRDEITQIRQNLPWRKVSKEYTFEGPRGKETLEDQFGNCSQLIVYHFMYAPEWEEGCKSCSFIADHYDPSVIHLAQRDVSLVAISRAPWEELEKFKKRMGWSFKWLSPGDSSFNYDFNVSFFDEQLQTKTAFYNFREGDTYTVNDLPSVSIFATDGKGQIFHTYSAYARALENLIVAYHLLDLVPKGRDESGLSYGMEWLRLKDQYGDNTYVDPYA